MASSAKSSALDKLHKLFVEELTSQLKGGTDENGNRVAPTAALLAVIGQTLFRSGTKPTSDSHAHQALSRAYGSLPFKAEDDEHNTDRKPN
jgi:ribosomal protein L16/L10AE